MQIVIWIREKRVFCDMAELSLTLDSTAMRDFAADTEPKQTPARSSEDGMHARTPAPDSDESLLIAVGNDQCTDAFNTLFNRFANKVFAHGMKITRNEQLSKDLVQEAMLTVWQKAPLYDLDRGTAQSWIFTLTRNRCFDMLRKQKRQPSCVSADDIWPSEEDEVDAREQQDSEFIGTELAQIDKFIKQLPLAQQAVVEQIYILDRTHEEAAVALDIPLGTLKSRLRLAMGKLRHLIGTE